MSISLDHVAIAAHDTDAMARWYENILGLVTHFVTGPNPPQKQKVYLIGPPLAAAADKALALARGMMIEIMPRNDTPRHDRNSHEPGWSHTAFAVTDFDVVLTRLKQHNVKFLSDVIPAIGGGRVISFEDCEGNMIQIVERSQGSSEVLK